MSESDAGYPRYDLIPQAEVDQAVALVGSFLDPLAAQDEFIWSDSRSKRVWTIREDDELFIMASSFPRTRFLRHASREMVMYRLRVGRGTFEVSRSDCGEIPTDEDGRVAYGLHTEIRQALGGFMPQDGDWESFTRHLATAKRVHRVDKVSRFKWLKEFWGIGAK